MFDPVLVKILSTTFTYGLCGCVVAVIMRVLNRGKSGPSLDQAAAIGFLVGAGFGALFAVFESLLVRQ